MVIIRFSRYGNTGKEMCIRIRFHKYLSVEGVILVWSLTAVAIMKCQFIYPLSVCFHSYPLIWTPSTPFSFHPFQTTPHTISSIIQITQHPTHSNHLHSLHSQCSSKRNSPISNKHSNLNQLTNPSSAISPFASGCVGSKSGESSPPRSPLSALR